MAGSPKAAPNIQYDHRDEISRNNPWPRWRQMRDDHPVHFSDVYGGFYVLPRYHEITDAARDTDTFSSAIGSTTIPEFPAPRLPPIHTDPPEARLSGMAKTYAETSCFRHERAPLFGSSEETCHEGQARRVVFAGEHRGPDRK